MLEGQGLFQLAARSAAYASLARDKGVAHLHNVFERSEKPSGLGQTLNTLKVDANTTIRAMFQAAWDKLHEDENFISDEMIKRLEKASKSDNKEIAAERLRQAKAKLRSLRLQAQMAAASGDPKQLKRIAQQAAQAAREVASAARGLAEGIAASAVPSDGSASAGNLPLATTQPQAEGTTPAVTVPTTPATPTLFGGEREALRKLGDEAHAAIAQAKGLIAFAAQAARNRRRQQDDGQEFFRQLQQSVQEAAQDLDSALTAAGQSLSTAESGLSGVSAVQTTTVMVQMSVEVSVTANIVI
ncbi:MAG TPA: hypothetical protein VEC60_07545 [Reyranella sp.]|nr:hypothetical protein [Reyranella sp.]